MLVRDLMTAAPAHCSPDTPLRQVAQMMADHDCGAIPVVKQDGATEPAGIVTDRDITVRLVARGTNPVDATASEAMTEQTVTCRADADVQEAARLMKDHQLRRLLVVDDGGGLTGILAQADFARQMSDPQTGDVVERISKPETRV